MQDFLFTLNTVLPTFIIIFLGYILLRVGMIDERFVHRSSAIIFRITLPLLIFSKMRLATFSAGNMLLPVMIFLVVTLIFVGIIWATTHYSIKRGETRGAFIQGAFRGNIAIIGIPIVSSMLGEGRETLAILSLAILLPVYNILAVIVLNVTLHTAERPSPIALFIKIIRNPLIIAVIAGLCMRNSAIPEVGTRTIDTLSRLTFPLALMGIGASLGGAALTLKAPMALCAGLIKTALLPLCVCTTALIMGIRDDRLATLLVVSGVPSAVSSFIMAKAMGSDGELAAGIVFFSTILSLPTLTLGIYIMRASGIV